MAIRNARKYIGDRLSRTAPPHAILDPANGAARRGQAAHPDEEDARRHPDRPPVARPRQRRTPIDGLYAAGQVAGFGGGGGQGYNALEGAFLGGCLFSGRAAGRDAAERLGGSSPIDRESPDPSPRRHRGGALPTMCGTLPYSVVRCSTLIYIAGRASTRRAA